MVPDAPRSLLDLTLVELARELAPLSPVHARALWRALYRDRTEESRFEPPLRRWVEAQVGAAGRWRWETLELQNEVLSGDGLTRKFLLRLDDGSQIETVLMGYTGRHTACVSSQAGCAMGCVFCATGQAGFVRHLRAGEIVAQVLHASAALSGDRLRNLVLMGMGEPLHNLDAVLTALEIVTDTRGLNLGPRRITISTVGIVPGILRLARERRPYGLAVSLHGATEEERSALVPISRRWPLAELIAACRTYCAETGRRIFIEWTLIAGINDSLAQAARLADLLAGVAAHVNLIPLNATSGFHGGAASGDTARQFQRALRARGLPSTIRQRRGLDVAAGCGQLAGNSAPERTTARC